MSGIPLVDLPRMRQAEGEVRMSVFALSVASRKKPIAVCSTSYTFILNHRSLDVPRQINRFVHLRTQRWILVFLFVPTDWMISSGQETPGCCTYTVRSSKFDTHFEEKRVKPILLYMGPKKPLYVVVQVTATLLNSKTYVQLYKLSFRYLQLRLYFVKKQNYLKHINVFDYGTST